MTLLLLPCLPAAMATDPATMLPAQPCPRLDTTGRETIGDPWLPQSQKLHSQQPHVFYAPLPLKEPETLPYSRAENPHKPPPPPPGLIPVAQPKDTQEPPSTPPLASCCHLFGPWWPAEVTRRKGRSTRLPKTGQVESKLIAQRSRPLDRS